MCWHDQLSVCNTTLCILQCSLPSREDWCMLGCMSSHQDSILKNPCTSWRSISFCPLKALHTPDTQLQGDHPAPSDKDRSSNIASCLCCFMYMLICMWRSKRHSIHYKIHHMKCTYKACTVTHMGRCHRWCQLQMAAIPLAGIGLLHFFTNIRHSLSQSDLFKTHLLVNFSWSHSACTYLLTIKPLMRTLNRVVVLRKVLFLQSVHSAWL